MARFNKEDIKTLGDAIRYIRWFVRMNQKEFAKELGLGVATLSLWERDVSKPTLANFKLLEKYIAKKKIKIHLPD